jgi:hypothetical protein
MVKAALAALSAYEDVDNWSDDGVENNSKTKVVHKPPPEDPLEVEYSVDDKKKSSRARPTLRIKNSIVQEYYDFVKDKENNVMTLSTTNEFSLRAYVDIHNSNPANKRFLHISNLSKWVRAERRGEYLPWNGINKLDSRTCKIVNVLRHIDFVLKTKYPCHGIFNQVSKSPSVPGEYGITARRYIQAGTFLGFYMGEVISGKIAQQRVESQEYMFTLGKNKFMDAKAYDSCFARYYNCAMNACDQNVSVERLDLKDPQRKIGFIANKHIQKGEELLISYGAAYWERAASKAPANSPFRRVCNAMLDVSPNMFQTLEPLYSMDALILAESFGDKSQTNMALTEDDENGSDSDYMDE